MSVWQNLFLGPYAAFDVAPEIAAHPPEEDSGELLGRRVLYCHGSETESRLYYMPRGPDGEIPRSASRRMYFSGQPAWPWVPDFSTIDPAAEVTWFQREYAADLAEIGAVLGVRPEFGWGLLAWAS